MNHTQPQENNDRPESVSHRVLDAIETKKLKPKPRWEFLLKRSVLWGAGAVSIVVGGLAVGAAIFALEHSGFKYRAATHASLFSFIMTTLPYLWIIMLAAFSGIAYYNIRHTEGGYRYPLVAIVSLSVLGSIALGTISYAAGFGEWLDEHAPVFAPFYHPVFEIQEELWGHPEEGRLVGTVTDFSEEDGVLTVEAFDGTMWRVLTDDLREPDLEALKNFETVRIVGVPTTTLGVLHACFVLPWEFVDTLPRPDARVRFDTLFDVMDEREPRDERSTECKDVRPYQALIKLQR